MSKGLFPKTRILLLIFMVFMWAFFSAAALGAEQENIKNPNTKTPISEENIASVVEFLCDYVDLDSAYDISGRLANGNGYLQGVPQLLYDQMAKFQLSAGRLQSIEAQDPHWASFVKSCMEGAKTILTASDLFAKAILTGQQAQTWNATAQDLCKKSSSYLNLSSQIMQSASKAFMEINPSFKNRLPSGLTYDLGVDKRPSIFRIGLYNYSREPLRIWYVVPGSLASTIGLKNDDIIVKAAGRNFGPQNNIEDFKVVLQEYLGLPIPVTVIRGGKEVTFEVKMPKTIPKEFLY